MGSGCVIGSYVIGAYLSHYTDRVVSHWRPELVSFCLGLEPGKSCSLAVKRAAPLLTNLYSDVGFLVDEETLIVSVLHFLALSTFTLSFTRTCPCHIHTPLSIRGVDDAVALHAILTS